MRLKSAFGVVHETLSTLCLLHVILSTLCLFINRILYIYSAAYVINEDGSRVRLSATDRAQREGIAKQLLTPSSSNALSIMPNKMVSSQLLGMYRESAVCYHPDLKSAK